MRMVLREEVFRWAAQHVQ